MLCVVLSVSCCMVWPAWFNEQEVCPFPSFEDVAQTHGLKDLVLTSPMA